jgi:hypothetical protein
MTTALNKDTYFITLECFAKETAKFGLLRYANMNEPTRVMKGLLRFWPVLIRPFVAFGQRHNFGDAFGSGNGRFCIQQPLQNAALH